MCSDKLSTAEPHEWSKCGKDSEVLVSKGLYKGNKDNNDYCTDCYEIVFNEKWEH